MKDTQQESPLRFFKGGFFKPYFEFKELIEDLAFNYSKHMDERDMAHILRNIADEMDPLKKS